ncbi:hypothetical protein ACOSQ4_015933 [Xanthoceras sorbifolium]
MAMPPLKEYQVKSKRVIGMAIISIFSGEDEEEGPYRKNRCRKTASLRSLQLNALPIHFSFCFQIHFNGSDLITNLRDQGPGGHQIVSNRYVSLHYSRLIPFILLGRSQISFLSTLVLFFVGDFVAQEEVVGEVEQKSIE